MAATNDTGSLFRKPRPVRILRSELQRLIGILETSDTSLTQFGSEVSRHPAVLQQLLRAANSSLTGCATEILDPTRATLFLGTRRVLYLLNTLPPEVIEEEDAENMQTI